MKLSGEPLLNMSEICILCLSSWRCPAFLQCWTPAHSTHSRTWKKSSVALLQCFLFAENYSTSIWVGVLWKSFTSIFEEDIIHNGINILNLLKNFKPRALLKVVDRTGCNILIIYNVYHIYMIYITLSQYHIHISWCYLTTGART